MYLVSQMMWPCGLVSADHHLLVCIYFFICLGYAQGRISQKCQKKVSSRLCLMAGSSDGWCGVVCEAARLSCLCMC